MDSVMTSFEGGYLYAGLPPRLTRPSTSNTSTRLAFLLQVVLNVTGSGLDRLEACFHRLVGPWRGHTHERKRQRTTARLSLITPHRTHPTQRQVPGAVQRVAIPPSSSSSSSHNHPAPAPGVCPACQGVLRPLGLDEEERRQLRERLLRLAEEKQAAWQRQGKVVLTSLGGNGNGSSGNGNGASASAPAASTAAGIGGAGEEREREAAEAKVVSLQALGEWLAAREPFDVRAECAACVHADGRGVLGMHASPPRGSGLPFKSLTPLHSSCWTRPTSPTTDRTLGRGASPSSRSTSSSGHSRHR